MSSMNMQASTSEGADKTDIFSMGRMANTMLSSGLTIPIADLCEHIRKTPSSAAACMHGVFWHKELHGVRHEFLVVEVRGEDDSTPVWVRLERAAKTEYKRSRKLSQRLLHRAHSLASIFPANDSAIVCSSWKKAMGQSQTQLVEYLMLTSNPTLGFLEQLLTAFCEVAVNYSLREVSLTVLFECEFPI